MDSISRSDNVPQSSLLDHQREMSRDELSEISTSNNELVARYAAGLKKQRIFKIIVIGDSNVGKTCLTFRFCGGKFPEKTEATIGVDFREKNVEIGGETVKLQIWDTAGQERFRRSMVQHYYRDVHAVVFVYDVTKASSFENLSVWIDECNMHNLGKDIPRIMVGNKCDLKDKLEVPTSVAQRFADLNQMPLFETSAKDNSKVDHVESIFLTLAHKLKNCKPWMQPVTPDAASINIQVFTNRKHSNSRSPEPDGGYCPC